MELTRLVADSALFSGIAQEDLRRVLHCTGAVKCAYHKGETILREHQALPKIGVLLSGKVQVARDDVHGNHYLLSRCSGRDLFGLALSTAQILCDDIYVYAETDCEVVLLEAKKLLTGCELKCECHSRLMKNALTIIADKNLALIRKQCHMAQHSLRAKLTSYLIEQSAQCGARQFAVPYKRQEWADYLGVDRSALCAELSRMKRDGLLDYNKNDFMLHNQLFL